MHISYYPKQHEGQLYPKIATLNDMRMGSLRHPDPIYQLEVTAPIIEMKLQMEDLGREKEGIVWLNE